MDNSKVLQMLMDWVDNAPAQYQERHVEIKITQEYNHESVEPRYVVKTWVWMFTHEIHTGSSLTVEEVAQKFSSHEEITPYLRDQMEQDEVANLWRAANKLLKCDRYPLEILKQRLEDTNGES